MGYQSKTGLMVVSGSLKADGKLPTVRNTGMSLKIIGGEVGAKANSVLGWH